MSSVRISIAVKTAVVAAAFIAVALWLPPPDSTPTVALDRLPVSSTPVPRPITPARTEPDTGPSEWVNAVEPTSADTAIEPGEPLASAIGLPGASGRSPISATPENGVARRELVTALQRELTRVGCYGGTVTGVWTASSKRAMSAFIERVNASLPLEQPDYILLALVQNHEDIVCQERPVRSASVDASEAPRKLDPPAWNLGGEELARRPPAPRTTTVQRFSFRPASDKGWRERVFEPR